jgi:nicotinate-nucleotide adenylyltransferase
VPRVGVFGGSFNPIHFGHLLLADEICEILDLDRVLFVPAAEPPHKPPVDLAPARHRFQMTALAIREHPRFEVSDVELRRSGPSYTVQTLEALWDRGDLSLMIGSETFLDLLSWRELGVPGFVPATDARPAAGLSPAAPVLVRAASLPISGSDLRRRAREGRSLAFRMPESVVAYIREHHLYGGDA